MQKKRFIRWFAGMLTLVIFLIIIILVYEPEENGIQRAAAFKAAALSMDSKEACVEQAKEQQSRFAAKDQNNWYVPYMDYLYQKGYLSEELTPARADTAEGHLTYGEVDFLAGQISKDLKNMVRMTKQNKNDPYPEDQWWYFFDQLLKENGSEQEIKEETILVYGTIANVETAKPWTVYTNKGDFGFDGLAMDAYIDNQLSVILRDKEIIRIKELVSTEVTYSNVWLSQGKESTYKVYLGSITREFDVKDQIEKPEQYLNNLADIQLKKGELTKISLKKDRIQGRVLEVKEDTIEIEGYGEVPLDENFKVYKTYGEFKVQKMSDLLVGYDLQEFIVANGKLCAALTVRPFDAEQIRVLLMDTGFKSIFHPQITLVSDVPLKLTYGKKEETVAAGEPFTITPDDERLKEGRLILQPEDGKSEIQVSTIERGLGTPSYGGRLEIKREEEGLVLVNELFLEEYLTKVVPSEMPSSYEMEALKAQAVCARTYAYRQIRSNSYSRYGAHVDDSTNYQVYNNIITDSKTAEAVNQTYGMLLLYNESPVEAYYFSTSCGHTTDGTIWGASPEDVPYLTGTLCRDGGGILNLTSNVDFADFIKNKNYASFESSFPFYRWSTSITNNQLEEKIGGIGTITGMTMRERGVGGIGKVLEVEGTEGTKAVKGQSQIRSLLGNKELVIKKNDGDTLTGWNTLPSAFIAIETDPADENGVITFRIYGGGYGHGVGMSQNGAQGMAKSGYTFDKILKFYYHDVQIKEP